MFDETCGFGELVERFSFTSEVQQLLPATCDRFLEARFFASKLLSLDATVELCNEANWYLGAHMSAVIGVLDAAKLDYRALKRSYKSSPIVQEFYLQSHASPASDRDCDPLAVNRAYRDLRNLRVHYAIPLASLERRMLIFDIPEHEKIPNFAPPYRWFLRPINASEHKKLYNVEKKHKPLLTQFEVTRWQYPISSVKVPEWAISLERTPN